jgi:diguanylate cyclase (GGDEF)-like protein
VEVADRVTGLLDGQAGAVVARLGGDELAVLLPRTDEDDAQVFAQRLVTALARPYAATPHLPVTASVGLVLSGPGERDPISLLRGADLAMYDAKSSGRGRWSRYTERMHAELLARVEGESDRRHGLQRAEHGARAEAL